jgi:hypothetical protein
VFVALFSAFILFFADVRAQAPGLPQRRVPMISQGAIVKQVVGLSEITVTYHRPGVKGRQIWGGLLPYDQVWRVGANDPTLITFSDQVTIEGRALPAGTYRFLAIPGNTTWTLIFNTEVKGSGAVHDPKYDTLRLTVTPQSIPHVEWLSFSFTDLTPTSATVEVAWEKLKVTFKAEFNTLAKLESQVGDWRVLNQAARYALTEKTFMDRATAWVDRSITLERNGVNVRTKAELLAGRGDFKGAIALAEESITLTKAQNPTADVSATEKLIADWKKK